MFCPDDSAAGRAILSRRETAELEAAAKTAGMTALWEAACQAVREGRTSLAEAYRVLGAARDSRPSGAGTDV